MYFFNKQFSENGILFLYIYICARICGCIILNLSVKIGLYIFQIKSLLVKFRTFKTFRNNSIILLTSTTFKEKYKIKLRKLERNLFQFIVMYAYHNIMTCNLLSILLSIPNNDTYDSLQSTVIKNPIMNYVQMMMA